LKLRNELLNFQTKNVLEILIAGFRAMTDVHDKKTRSFNMSRIRGKDTKPEILVRKFLFSKGFRYRLHVKTLAGTPDLVFPKLKTALFVHGCYWHGHSGCRYFVVPKTRTEWWQDKIQKNKQRDFEARRELESNGWNVLTIFECELKPKIRAKSLADLALLLKSFFSS
jgi:DNA mismatch endonuclease, patch repair protein